MKNHENLTKLIEEVTGRLLRFMKHFSFSTVRVNLGYFNFYSDKKEWCCFNMGYTMAPLNILPDHPVRVIPLKEKWHRAKEGYLTGYERTEIFLIKDGDNMLWCLHTAQFRAKQITQGPYQFESTNSLIEPITSWDDLIEFLEFDPTEKILQSIASWINLEMSDLDFRTEDLKPLRSDFDQLLADRRNNRVESLQGE